MGGERSDGALLAGPWRMGPGGTPITAAQPSTCGSLQGELEPVVGSSDDAWAPVAFCSNGHGG